MHIIKIKNGNGRGNYDTALINLYSHTPSTSVYNALHIIHFVSEQLWQLAIFEQFEEIHIPLVTVYSSGHFPTHV